MSTRPAARYVCSCDRPVSAAEREALTRLAGITASIQLRRDLRLAGALLATAVFFALLVAAALTVLAFGEQIAGFLFAVVFTP